MVFSNRFRLKIFSRGGRVGVPVFALLAVGEPETDESERDHHCTPQKIDVHAWRNAFRSGRGMQAGDFQKDTEDEEKPPEGTTEIEETHDRLPEDDVEDQR